MQPLSQSEELLLRELFDNSISANKISKKKLESIVKLSGDVSTRKYYRLFCGGKNYVVCIDSPENLTKEDFNFISTQKVLKDSNVPVPEIYDVRVDRGYVIMEDLGDETLLTQNAECESLEEEEKAYRQIVDNLLTIHQIDSSKHTDHSIHRMAFDEEKFFWEIGFTNKNLLSGYLGNNSKTIANEIENLFQPIVKKILEIPKIVVHRDFHSRNIMYFDKKHYIIDFQDARQGPVQYDIVSLLEDAYYGIQRTNRFAVKKYFYQSLCDKKIIDMSFDEFIIGYDHCAFQRIYKAIGTFCFILNERNDPRYIRYVHSCFERLKALLYKYDEYKELRKLLSVVYYGY